MATPNQSRTSKQTHRRERRIQEKNGCAESKKNQKVTCSTQASKSANQEEWSDWAELESNASILPHIMCSFTFCMFLLHRLHSFNWNSSGICIPIVQCLAHLEHGMFMLLQWRNFFHFNNIIVQVPSSFILAFGCLKLMAIWQYFPPTSSNGFMYSFLLSSSARLSYSKIDAFVSQAYRPSSLSGS